MSIGLFIAILAFLAAGSHLAITSAAGNERSLGGVNAGRAYASVIVVASLAVAIALRDTRFGIDTFTYLYVYGQYCTGVSNVPLDLSYISSFTLINALSLGACDPRLLPAVWVAALIGPLLLMPGRRQLAFGVACLVIISIIGIDLATNAMRQAFSVAVLTLAVAWFQKRKHAGIILASTAVVLHPSAALTITAVIISGFSFRYYIAAALAGVLIIVNYSALGFSVPLLDALIYQVDKYAAHDASDFWVRAMSALQLVVPFASIWATGARKDPDLSAAALSYHARALRIALTAIPFLFLPYFGYRYVYGIYPIVLLMCAPILVATRRPAFELTFAGSALITLVWAFGSSAVRHTPFIW